MKPVFICDALRTPFGRYGGALASMRTDDLAAHPLIALMARHPQLDWAAVDDVIYGCTNQAGEDNRNVARMALLLAGLPDTVSGSTVNRLCGSSLEAIAVGARAIANDEADLIIAGGVESMSRAPFVVSKSTAAYSRGVEMHDTTLGWRLVNQRMRERYGVDSLGLTAENVADENNISRVDQDAFALRSQQRAHAALVAGRLAEEISPVDVPGRRGQVVTVDRDEHPRADVTADSLARLPAAFRENGTVTAGNASGVNDGAGALILASESAVARHRLTPSARYIGAATAGVPPRVMGIGPVPATRRLLDRLHLTIADFDVIELNEAFAAQALAVLRQLGLADDAEHVNPNGGAIALGHPLGASGVRLAMTAVNELRRRGGRRGLCTMCIGVGQGMAMAIERV